MTSRTVYLLTSRTSSAQRAHFAIFFPSATNQDIGTLIQVIGAPMMGYQLEFNRNYSPASAQPPCIKHGIGQIDSQHIADATDDVVITDSAPKCAVEVAAVQIPPPGISENFLAPVNDTTNRRCQEWTMDYIRRLVQLQYLDDGAIQIVQSKRDPPNHGIGLQSLGQGKGSE